jgi:hypothetical protein
MIKMSGAQASEILKTSAASLRALSEENQTLKTKVAAFEKKASAERLARAMEEKGLNDGLSFEEKVASIMERDDLTVLEQAVGMSAPQMKLASVEDSDEPVAVQGADDGSRAEDTFATNLASME